MVLGTRVRLANIHTAAEGGSDDSPAGDILTAYRQFLILEALRWIRTGFGTT
jgi:hypothetical protein